MDRDIYLLSQAPPNVQEYARDYAHPSKRKDLCLNSRVQAYNFELHTNKGVGNRKKRLIPFLECAYFKDGAELKHGQAATKYLLNVAERAAELTHRHTI